MSSQFPRTEEPRDTSRLVGRGVEAGRQATLKPAAPATDLETRLRQRIDELLDEREDLRDEVRRLRTLTGNLNRRLKAAREARDSLRVKLAGARRALREARASRDRYRAKSTARYRPPWRSSGAR